YNGLGLALYMQKEVPEAIAAFRKAIEIDAKYADAHTNLGALLCDELKDYDQAIECFRKPIDIDPKCANAYYNLAVGLLKHRTPYDAIDAFRTAIVLDPLSISYNGLGLALRMQKEVPEAIAAFRKAIEIDPKCADAHCNLGALLCDELKDYDKAIECF